MCMGKEMTSLRSSERGLKYYVKYLTPVIENVAPFVGAWIEMSNITKSALSHWSLRSSERGLKYKSYRKLCRINKSLRSSERGLKFSTISSCSGHTWSLRSSERGLKYHRESQQRRIFGRSVRRSGSGKHM